MTENEIIKALECCSQEDMCGHCPYGAACLDEKYISKVSIDALDLINRQKAEVERLKLELEFKCDNCENIRLSREEYRKTILQAKSEAIKNFLNQLKIHAYYPERSSSSVINQRVVDEDDIDMVAKELLGGMENET